MIVGLVLLLLLLIIPLGIGVAMGVCPDCTAAAGTLMFAAACAMLAVAISIFAVGILTTVARGNPRPPGLVALRGIERPPRSY